MRLFDRFRKEEKWPAWVKPSDRRAIDVGWLLVTDKARFIWFDPVRVKRDDPPPTHAKSASYCPAMLEHEARLFQVNCPIDLRLRLGRDASGKAVLVNAAGEGSTIRGKHLNEMLALVPEREWRHPERPVIQIVTPYIFVADEPVWMTQIPPYVHYRRDPWPGIMMGGRLPIHIWPRPMMWAFEWHEPGKELVLRRGEPWFFVRFETHDPTRPVRMVEADHTPALEEHIKGASAVSNYVDNTYELYKVAAARRPDRLLVPKRRGDGTVGGEAEGRPLEK